MMRLFLSLCFILIIALVLIAELPKVKSQSAQRANELDFISKDGVNLPKYEYEIGNALLDSLLDKCSIFTGVVLNNNTTGDTVSIDFSIEEWLSEKPESANDYVQIKYTNFSSPKMSVPNIWTYVKIETGKRLLVSDCQQFTDPMRYSLIVSNADYFPSIKEVIEYNSNILSDETLLSHVPELLDKKRTFIFAGYIIQRMWRLGTIGKVDLRAKVLTDLLGNKNIPEIGRGQVRGQIEYLMGGNSLQPETIDEITFKLVNLASGDHQEEASEAILMLVRLSKKEKFNFKQYLKRTNAAKLIQNYKSLVITKITAEDRKNFEKQLLEN